MGTSLNIAFCWCSSTNLGTVSGHEYKLVPEVVLGLTAVKRLGQLFVLFREHFIHREVETQARIYIIAAKSKCIPISLT